MWCSRVPFLDFGSKDRDLIRAPQVQQWGFCLAFKEAYSLTVPVELVSERMEAEECPQRIQRSLLANIGLLGAMFNEAERKT